MIIFKGSSTIMTSEIMPKVQILRDMGEKAFNSSNKCKRSWADYLNEAYVRRGLWLNQGFDDDSINHG